MGVDSRSAPPLPAPTETDSVISTPTEIAPSDVSKPADDDRSHYSLPDDGTPVTIKTRGHRPNRSQTSLLIEYFEGGKNGGSGGSASSERKPSVRVRLTPSKTRGKNDHIQITETKSTRKVSSRKATASPNLTRSELDMTDPEDARSMHSYASATEESNVSRNPIEVEIDPGSRHRRRKVSSPLIPAADSKVSTYQPPNMSDISAIPSDSFLDGSGGGGGGTSLVLNEKRARSPAPTAEKVNRKVRSSSHDRSVMQKAVEKASKPERRHKSKSRTSSSGDKENEKRRSKGSHKESVVSAADSSNLSSQITASHRSYDSHSSSKVSINNPKLLETVEDAIRRLILPELDAIKRERSQRETRNKDRESFSSLTSVSREEITPTSKRKSADTTHSTKSKDRRDREARNDLSPQSSIEQVSVTEDVQDEDLTPRRDRNTLTDATLGAAVTDATIRSRSRGDEKRQRRRRRAETPKRDNGERYADDRDDTDHEVVPPMPLQSEINPSDMTRTSILSAETDRPHSASEEMTPVREVTRGHASMESIQRTPTPSKSPSHTLQGLGAQHANVSHGDLKALPRKGNTDYRDEYRTDEFGNRYPAHGPDEYEDDYDEAGHLEEPGMYDDESGLQSFYGSQDVPAPLRYVPYQQERRGLSPIQSVSGYTEGESDVHGYRDSRTIHTASEISSPEKSPHHDRDLHSPSSVPSNLRSREFVDEGSSVRNSDLDYRNTTYTDDSELDRVTSGQAVQVVGGNPQMVHQNYAPESAVASLVEGSQLDPSVLSGSTGGRQDYRNSQFSYDDEAAREARSRGVSPTKRSVESRHESVEQRHDQSPAPSRERDLSTASREFSEYELNEYGQKVPKSKYRNSPTASESAITSVALQRAAAAALKRKAVNQQSPNAETKEGEFVGEGVSRNRSFKERAKDGYRPDATPRHSVDRLSDYDHPKLGASGLPDLDNPMPEIGYGYEPQTPSVVHEPLGGPQQGNGAHWPRESTPTYDRTYAYDRAVTPKASRPDNSHGLGISDAAAAATIATAGALATSHSRQPSQDQDDEWQRTSGDRKRDTLVTNPYEGASPIANLPGIDGNMLGGTGFGTDAYRGGFHTGSPGIAGGDEGYISAAPNEVRDRPNAKGKDVGILNQPNLGESEDPFFAPKDARHLAGLSQAMGTPLYDPSTGTGIDRIQSKDIIALMEHLMVRDAQRSARDTEILVTLVRSAAEMRNSFEDMKRMLADSEDQIINEVKDNTEKTVKRHIGGPRPFPGSSARSVQGGSQAGTEETNVKKRNLLRRALQGLGSKGANDLGKIEDLLNQLLDDVNVLKHQTAGPIGMMSTRAQSIENIQPEVHYEQDRGYEPEGHAGTSTASHASQSGHLSIPQSRGTSNKMGNERKFSDHRISTVPEDEGEYNDHPMPPASQYEMHGGMLSPSEERTRGGSVPLGTPPQNPSQAQNYSVSNENTPRTEESKKHKRGSSSFFPKISRWSETTTSSIGRVFRSSGASKKHDTNDDFPQPPPSRSASDLGNYDQFQQHQNMYESDKLHTGFSEQDLSASPMDNIPHDTSSMHQQEQPPMQQPAAPIPYSTPEDPKYRAHRNSVNLQHPQPRPGRLERFGALETSAQDYDTPMSPRSADWAGSATSLHRFPQNTNRYSDNSAMNSGHGGDDYQWQGLPSPSPQGPPRPPKEPLDGPSPALTHTPPQHDRVNKLQKKQGSPLPYHSVESGYGTATATHAGSYHSGSPKFENRNLSGALGVPTRRPSGPRAMTPSRGSDDGEERRRKRDTFGTVASPSSAISQESETF
ncbi:hypothetical protein F5Y06DRAFT_101743 [Hypoxylon sp. FL0890]|nr:hypothetical protein F5Y06DRAFT_101743 [Hypoxylon sp. FL0890]